MSLWRVDSTINAKYFSVFNQNIDMFENFCSIVYRLNYTFSDPTQITVAERDSALQKFKTEFQNYVDNLSEADLASSNIKTVLSEKADELENSLSTAKMKLSCEVENVEVHNAGEEIVNN